MVSLMLCCFVQAEDGIGDATEDRGRGEVDKRKYIRVCNVKVWI